MSKCAIMSIFNHVFMIYQSIFPFMWWKRASIQFTCKTKKVLEVKICFIGQKISIYFTLFLDMNKLKMLTE